MSEGGAGPEGGGPARRHGPAPAHRVRFPLMRMKWEALTFLHWAYPVEEVQSLLPAGIEVEPWDGRAWVGLVPLYMRVRLPVGPSVAGLTTFPETNVRTYVVGPDGEPGVWFFSLDAANPPAVAAGRAAFGLPYFLSKMDLRRDGDKVHYTARRARARGRADRASHRIEVEAGDEIAQSGLSEFDHYLTARFRLWSLHLGAVLVSDQEHAPWRLRTATVLALEQDLLESAGLPTPAGEPVVRYADGIDVRVARPRISRRPKVP